MWINNLGIIILKTRNSQAKLFLQDSRPTVPTEYLTSLKAIILRETPRRMHRNIAKYYMWQAQGNTPDSGNVNELYGVCYHEKTMEE